MTIAAIWLGLVAFVWLQVMAASETDDYYGYDDTVEFTDWAEWDWPIPDDNDAWKFPKSEHED